MIKVLILILTASLLNGEILEVKQLFNKRIVSVKSEQRTINRIFYADTKLDESKIYDVSLRFSGFVEKLYANESFMSVKKGDKLLSIYSQTLSDIKEEIDLSRQMGQKTAVKNLRKKLSLLKAGSKISSNYTVEVKAPNSGIILEKNINQGSFVKSGELLYKIADLKTIWVILKVYQKDLDFIKKGMKATVMIDGIDKLEAEVDFIYPFMNPKSKMVDVRVIVKNPKLKIYPNLFAKVIVKSDTKTMLTLPKSAVLTKGAKHFVFKPINESEFEPIEITAKRIDSHTFRIEGLKEGDRVIDRALFMLDSDAITNGLYDSNDDEEW